MDFKVGDYVVASYNCSVMFNCVFGHLFAIVIEAPTNINDGMLRVDYSVSVSSNFDETYSMPAKYFRVASPEEILMRNLSL